MSLTSLFLSEVNESCKQLLCVKRRVLSKALDNDGEEKAYCSITVYFKAVRKIDLKRSLNVWQVSEMLPPIQMLPPQILYDPRTQRVEEELLRKLMNIPENQWSREWLERLSMYDVA